ncbi:MAG: translation initiation factor IF-2 [Dongiaceae bacterium]
MTTKDSGDETKGQTPLKLSRPGRLELKKTVDGGQVRQSFSHGRSKTVAVEVKRRRSIAPGGKSKPEAEPEVEATETPVAAPAPAPAAPPPVDTRPVRGLTADERAARSRAVEEAKHYDEQRRVQADEEAKRRTEEEVVERARLEAEQAANPPADAAAAEAEAQRAAAHGVAMTPLAGTERAERAGARGGPRLSPRAQQILEADIAEEAEQRAQRQQVRRPGGGVAARPPARPAPGAGKRGEPRRRQGKLNVQKVLDDDGSERTRSLASVRRAREREKLKARGEEAPGKIVRDVIIPETITVQELANRMAERGTDVIKSLMRMGTMATITQTIDADTAEVIATEFGHRVRRVSAADVELGLFDGHEDIDAVAPRSPVVTVMGHVDHGKTSLLDALRQTDVAAGEAGGITQHIGAYQVTRPSGQKITFIDTPGHAAFTEMRARGANVTDIVVLVVAADDGIMAQTIEAIHHARAAKVPVIVAVNKIDKPDANPQRVRQELLSHEIVPEELGGDVQVIDVSAKTGQNLDKLEEGILLQAEILELKANTDRAAQGAVIEARLERGRGPVATLLVQRGTLRVGDIFVAGAEWGRVRAMLDDRGNTIDEAGPSMPVEVLGLQGAPNAGDLFAVVENEAKARQVSEYRANQERDKQAVSGARGTLDEMFQKIAAGETKELPVVVKADVQGSVEALAGALSKLGTNEVAARLLHTGVGGINESDVTLARASNALIVGFNVRANAAAREMARRDGVDIRYYSIIYNVVDDIRAMLTGMLAPQMREKFLGNAEIREVFNITKAGKVAGCMVTEGTVKRGAKVRLLRDNVVIHEGSLRTLKRFKDEVREVKEGFECGMAFENYQDIQVGDTIECFEIEEVARALEA